MKPMNFPGRKLARQRGALQRLLKRSGCKLQMKINKLQVEMDALTAAAAMTDNQARNIRTKKYRGDAARFSRA